MSQSQQQKRWNKAKNANRRGVSGTRESGLRNAQIDYNSLKAYWEVCLKHQNVHREKPVAAGFNL